MSPSLGAGAAGAGATGVAGAGAGAGATVAGRVGFFTAGTGCGGLFTWYCAGSCVFVVLGASVGASDFAAAGVAVAGVAGCVVMGVDGSGTATCFLWQDDSQTRNNTKLTCNRGNRSMGH